MEWAEASLGGTGPCAHVSLSIGKGIRMRNHIPGSLGQSLPSTVVRLLSGAQTAGCGLPGCPQALAQLAPGQGQPRHNSEGDKICLRWTSLSFLPFSGSTAFPGPQFRDFALAGSLSRGERSSQHESMYASRATLPSVCIREGEGEQKRIQRVNA